MSSTRLNQEGQKTTITIATEDESFVRRLLDDPEAVNKNKATNSAAKKKNQANKQKRELITVTVKASKKKKESQSKKQNLPKKLNESVLKPKQTQTKTSATKNNTSKSNGEKKYHNRFIVKSNKSGWVLIDTTLPNSDNVIGQIIDFHSMPYTEVEKLFKERMQEILGKTRTPLKKKA